MAGVTFLQFGNWKELEEYCIKNSYRIIHKKGYSIIADVKNQNDALVGYVSDRPQDFKPINPNTKYVLVWE